MLKIQLLGRFAVSVDGRPVDLHLRAAQSLLAYLALSTGKACRREQLAGLLWPNADEASAKGNLRHTLWRLRKALDDHDCFVADDLTITFDPTAESWLDAKILSAKPDAGATPEALMQVVSLYEGELLPGFYDEWVVLERDRLRAAFESWMTLLLDKLVAACRWDDAIEWSERWISLGHTPEAAYRALIMAHGSRGDSSNVAAAYRRCVSALRDDLGVDPSPQTRAAYERWLKGDLGQLANDLPARPLRGYQLEERIGSGAFGVVYRAFQPGVGRRVAIKVIAPEHANHPDFIRMFEAEARLVAQLEHPHIVPLFDYWREPGGAYLVMRWLPRNLRSLMVGTPLSLADALSIIDQIGGALIVAHRHGIAHLDLKPDNVLLDEDGNAYLADFGIARTIDRTSAPGSAPSPMRDYSSPEQIQGEPATMRSDLYSLGLVIFEMLAGRHPFHGATPVERIDRQIGSPLPSLSALSPSVPVAIDRVIQRATARDPGDRYPDVAALLDDLHQAALGGKPGPEFDGAPATPYKGLRAFEEADSADFFGRDALVNRLVSRLTEPGALTRLLTVVGPSGCGKSSVVRAGLIPALRLGAVPCSERWFIVLFTPGEHALKSLEAALLSIAARPPAFLLEQLQTNTRGLLWAADAVLGEAEGDVLLVIDQFEELFTLATSEAERAQFLELLCAAVTDPTSRLRVILTLRADFTDRPLQYTTFGELMRQRMELVLPLSPEELGRAVIGPAARVGVKIEDSLLAAIVADVSEEPGALPMLQYALTETFERRDGRVMTLDAYHEAGGVSGALAHRADEVYASLGPAGQAAARQMFLRLVTLGEGVEDTRRRVLRSELEALDDRSQFLPNERAADVAPPGA